MSLDINNNVTIVCDGSALGNGTNRVRCAACAIIKREGKYKIVYEYLGIGTNQQAEIVAACIGLESITDYDSIIEVLTDSQYVVKTMQGSFKRKTNHSFWDRLDKASKNKDILWTWIKGHSGHTVQEMCDTIARTGAINMGKLSNRYLASFEERLNK